MYIYLILTSKTVFARVLSVPEYVPSTIQTDSNLFPRVFLQYNDISFTISKKNMFLN